VGVLQHFPILVARRQFLSNDNFIFIKELSVHIYLTMFYHFTVAAEDVVLLQLVTDESIIAVSENCVGLQCLGVSRCSRLTDAALVALGQTCTELQYICSPFVLLLLTEYNYNNNIQDDIYGAVIMAQSHCKSSPGSFDECRLSAG